jgi:hypothetical protein
MGHQQRPLLICQVTVVAFYVHASILPLHPAFRAASNDRYVAVQTDCDGNAIYSTREIFVGDVTTGEMVQVTDYVQQYKDRIIPADYTITWMDADELWISVLVRGETILHFETLSYSPSAKTLKKVDDGRIQQVFRNPLDTTFMMRRVSLQRADAGEQQQSSLELRGVQNTQVRSRLPHLLGCDLMWSPDGNYFSSSMRKDKTCFGQIEQFLIANNAGEILAMLPLDNSVKYPDAYFVPLGWVER